MAQSNQNSQAISIRIGFLIWLSRANITFALLYYDFIYAWWSLSKEGRKETKKLIIKGLHEYIATTISLNSPCGLITIVLKEELKELMGCDWFT